MATRAIISFVIVVRVAGITSLGDPRAVENLNRHTDNLGEYLTDYDTQLVLYKNDRKSTSASCDDVLYDDQCGDEGNRFDDVDMDATIPDLPHPAKVNSIQKGRCPCVITGCPSTPTYPCPSQSNCFHGNDCWTVTCVSKNNTDRHVTGDCNDVTCFVRNEHDSITIMPSCPARRDREVMDTWSRDNTIKPEDDDDDNDDSDEDGNDDSDDNYGSLTSRDRIVTSQQLRHFPCPDGFWDSFVSSSCVRVLCSQGRHLTTEMTNGQLTTFQCQDENGHGTWGDDGSGKDDGDDDGVDDDDEESEQRPKSVLYVMDVWWVQGRLHGGLGRGRSHDNNSGNGLNAFLGDGGVRPDKDNTSHAEGDGTGEGAESRDSVSYGGNQAVRVGDEYDAGGGGLEWGTGGGREAVTRAREDGGHLDPKGDVDGNVETEPKKRKPEISSKKKDDASGTWGVGISRRNEIDLALIAVTSSKLFAANITGFLLSIATMYHYLDGTVKHLEIYFTFKSNVRSHLLEESIIRSLSNSTVNLSLGSGYFVSRYMMFTKLGVKNDSSILLDEHFYRCYSNYSKLCYQRRRCEFRSELQKLKCATNETNQPSQSVTSTCPHIILNATSFNASDNVTLRHRELAFALKRHQFDISDDLETISTCIETLENMRSHLLQVTLGRDMVRDNLLLFICYPVSVLCLLLSLITYLVFPSLRTSAGRINMSLIWWLLLSQATTLFNPLVPRKSGWCAAHGVMLHYTWMAAWYWMGASSVHMYSVFVVGRSSSAPALSPRQFFIRATILCNGLPVLTVILVVLLAPHVISPGQDHVRGFGGPNCYLKGDVLSILSTHVPFAVVIVTNTTLFTITVVTISRTKEVKGRVGRERRNVRVCLSLCSLIGVTWLLQLLCRVPGLEILDHPGQVCGGGQGVAIFVCYTCNRRTRRLWAGLVSSKLRQTGTGR